MTLSEAILLLSDRYCEASGLSRSRVSTIVFNSGMAIDRIAQGKNFTNRSYERALTFFSDNWPDDAEWPASVVRPPNFVGTGVSA